MKHNTHIYVASKAIGLIRQSVDNCVDADGAFVSGAEKTKERLSATDRQRILDYYHDLITEASWAPDDVLRDNDPYHIFKLFTDKDFPDHNLTHRPKFERDDVTYYKFAGGLPYKIDHLAQEIKDMCKLRNYNDKFELRQIMYMYLLISHYLVDAHVPMHCDLRDDPPSPIPDDQPSRRQGSQKPAGKYMKSTAHSDLEKLWDDAVTPVAIEEKIIDRTWDKEKDKRTDLSDAVTFGLQQCEKGGEVLVPIIPQNGLMDFLVDVCIQSKERGQILFPPDDPTQRDDEELPEITKQIFADAIGNLMAVWRYIWTYGHEH